MGQAQTRLEHADIPATPALKLVFIINDVDEYTNDIYQHFPHLFQGLGTVVEAYQVTLKPNATTHALYAPTCRNVPIPLRDKVRGACKDGTYECDISHVDSPTEWCVGIVVVPK